MITPEIRAAMIEQLRPNRQGSRFPTPGDLARHIDPRTIQTPALDLIDRYVMNTINTPDSRLMVFAPPQEGKSQRVSRDLPIWMLTRNPDLRIVSGSYAQGLANRNGRAVRNAIQSHPALGLTIARDNGSAGEWSIEGHLGGLISVGRGAGINGRPADVLLIDDPIKDRAEADSKAVRDTCWDWWTDALSARLSPGAPVILITTRWHPDDLAGRLQKLDRGSTWTVLNISAQADHDPAKGEVDVLGRRPGEFMQSARRRTQAQWEQRKATAGARSWNALYQGRPTIAGGGILRRDWWRRYATPLWTVREDGAHLCPDMDELIISADLAFKATEASDYIAIGVWGRRGANVYLLDQVHGRKTFPETLEAFRMLYAKWPQAALKLVEDKANGPALIAMLSQKIGGIVPVNPTTSKTSRVNAWVPFLEAGNVWLPADHLALWVDGYVEEAAEFPNGAHDDQVDQTSMALDRLLIRPLLAQTITDDDIDDGDDYDYGIGY